jgi:alpha-L-rhamnosidase
MVHTFYLWRCADITAKTARILGKNREAKQYEDLAEKTRMAFHKRFYNENKGTYGKNGGNIFALRMGVPSERHDKVVDALRRDIEAADGHLDTGIFGTQFFFEVLSENGMHQLAYEAMNKRTAPGYGYWIEQGATTTREGWINFGSHNHPMFGGGLVWFYRKLAGMNADPENPGYKHILFRPQPVDQMDFVTYRNNTPFGWAGITWKNEPSRFAMDITVPVGSLATVYVPADAEDEVLESAQKPDPETIAYLGRDEGYAIFSVGSGDYHFTVGSK